jgi:putative oxidoreductase
MIPPAILRARRNVVSTTTGVSAEWEPRVRSIVRFVIGLLFLEHGTAKLFGFPHTGMFDHLPPLLMAAGIIEALGGLLFCLGLFTRVVAFIMSGEMAVGYFMAHAPKSFFPALNGGDAAVLYCFIFFYFFVAGAGVWSLDNAFARTPARS